MKVIRIEHSDDGQKVMVRLEEAEGILAEEVRWLLEEAPDESQLTVTLLDMRDEEYSKLKEFWGW